MEFYYLLKESLKKEKLTVAYPYIGDYYSNLSFCKISDYYTFNLRDFTAFAVTDVLALPQEQWEGKIDMSCNKGRWDYRHIIHKSSSISTVLNISPQELEQAIIKYNGKCSNNRHLFFKYNDIYNFMNEWVYPCSVMAKLSDKIGTLKL